MDDRQKKHSIDRRTFLKGAGLLGVAAACPLGLALTGAAAAAPATGDDERFVREARFYEKLPYKKIRCKLCPRECVIDEMERGYCGVRENRNGTYYTLVYSRPCTYHADPIEKKPFFHVLPGSLAFSIATAGCNVNCKFCQNWEISQTRPEQVRSIYMPPKKVVVLARETKCRSIAYTYSEPVIFYEYMMDAAAAGRDSKILSVVVTGGYIHKEPLVELCKMVDAIKVDLKSYSESYYRDVVNGELKPVLDALVTMIDAGVWTEIVYLVVPTLNDGDDELAGLSRWIVSNLGPDVPVHFTRFHPQYLLKNLPPTPVETLERAKAIADAEGLRYVYVGNVPGHPAEHTFCPGCGRAVVERRGYRIYAVHIDDGTCKFCNGHIAGVWNSPF
ncbi:MAG: AmmeMemoRadiSam system radical SAM enzyme [Candidatus Latescibacterota bacterium]|nr:MAG: AmmeMemoRadiSam system radical SAM enzyme [Candidatus Latescibacterota bacterium]